MDNKWHISGPVGPFSVHMGSGSTTVLPPPSETLGTTIPQPHIITSPDLQSPKEALASLLLLSGKA